MTSSLKISSPAATFTSLETGKHHDDVVVVSSNEDHDDNAGGCLTKITATVSSTGTRGTAIYTAVAAWFTYFCIYGFRKAWSAATWEATEPLLGFEPKSWLTIAQALGYAVGKFVSISAVSSLPTERQLITLLALPTLTFIIWISFGAVFPISPVATAICMFFSVMPLSWAWSLLYRHVEGRDMSDILSIAISSSYIVGSGVSKSIGQIVLDSGVSEHWMPALTCAIYAVPVFVFATLVSVSPPPTADEKARNAPRDAPMTLEQQIEFLRQHWPGLLLWTVSYAIVVAIRDFRDFFQTELFEDLNSNSSRDSNSISASTFTATEVPVAVAVLLGLSSLGLIRNNRTSVLAQILTIIGANFLILISQLLFNANYIGGNVWFIALGIGSYLCLVLVGSMFYDRLIGAIGASGTASFMINLSDCAGYIGTVVLLIYKAMIQSTSDAEDEGTVIVSKGRYEPFFSSFVLYGTIVSLISGVLTLGYWQRKLK